MSLLVTIINKESIFGGIAVGFKIIGWALFVFYVLNICIILFTTPSAVTAAEQMVSRPLSAVIGTIAAWWVWTALHKATSTEEEVNEK
jgi:hypothetical protein